MQVVCCRLVNVAEGPRGRRIMLIIYTMSMGGRGLEVFGDIQTGCSVSGKGRLVREEDLDGGWVNTNSLISPHNRASSRGVTHYFITCRYHTCYDCASKGACDLLESWSGQFPCDARHTSKGEYYSHFQPTLSRLASGTFLLFLDCWESVGSIQVLRWVERVITREPPFWFPQNV